MPPAAAASAQAERTVPVWDPLVRIVHWSVALAVLLNGALLDEEGAAHVWVGYAVLGLVALRLLWGLIGPRPARFSAFRPSVPAALRHGAALLTRRAPRHLSHNPIGALMVWNLWLTLLAIVATGLMMESAAFFGSEIVEEAHEALFGWLMISTGLHVAGVVVESMIERQSLVRAMIDGRKRPASGEPGA